MITLPPAAAARTVAASEATASRGRTAPVPLGTVLRAARLRVAAAARRGGALKGRHRSREGRGSGDRFSRATRIRQVGKPKPLWYRGSDSQDSSWPPQMRGVRELRELRACFFCFSESVRAKCMHKSKNRRTPRRGRVPNLARARTFLPLLSCWEGEQSGSSCPEATPHCRVRRGGRLATRWWSPGTPAVITEADGTLVVTQFDRDNDL